MLSTTKIDSHNMKITKKALENGVDQMNDKENILGFGYEHDLTIMPLGKWRNAELIRIEDGEYGLFAELLLFDIKNNIKINGKELILLKNKDDKRAFRGEVIEKTDKIIASIDKVNFESEEDYEVFRNNLQNIELKNLIRKSLIPDPEIIIQVGEIALVFLLGKIVDKGIDEAVIDPLFEVVKNTFLDIKKVVNNGNITLCPKNKKITYVIYGEYKKIKVEFIIKTRDTEELMKMLSKEKMKNIKKEIKECKEVLDVDKIQFCCDLCNEEWRFNFLTTKDGAIVGTKRAYNKREKAIEKIKLKEGFLGK